MCRAPGCSTLRTTRRSRGTTCCGRRATGRERCGGKPDWADGPATPATAVTFQGNGSIIIYIDWDNDLVIVVRWIQQRSLNEFLGQVLAAMR
jgi:hypothetical protein